MKNSSIKWMWISLLIVIIDQLSKYYINLEFSLYQSVIIFPGFNITHVHNTGAAFSFLSDASGWQRWFFILISAGISVGLIVWIAFLNNTRVWLAVGLALILGGALGNLIDRVLLGYVIDFIDVYYNKWHWPAFNVADSAISIGAAMLIIDTFWLDQAEVGNHG